MHFLWKAFSEKRGLEVFQNFLLSVIVLLFTFPKWSLLFLRKIFMQRFLCLLERLFASFLISRKYLFRSFELFIMAFLKFLVTKLELFSRINFSFYGACLSSIDSTIQFSLKYLIIKVFKAPVLDDFWFLFFVENFQNCNDHFMEI